jgi:hypothetical protein
MSSTNTSNKPPSDTRARTTVSPSSSTEPGWSAPLQELEGRIQQRRASKQRRLLELYDADDEDNSRVSITLVNQAPRHSLRPADMSRGKFAGILIGIGIGLAAVADLAWRLWPYVAELMTR